MKHNLFQKEFLKGVLVKDISLELLNEMVPIGDLTSSQVMGVYQEDYRARLFEVLGENFETCWFVLGDDEFMDIANAYVEEHPSSFTNLLHYGDDFPTYLSERAEGINFLEDLANFELFFWRLFHNKDNSLNFDPKELGEEIFSVKLSLCDNFIMIKSEVEFSSLWQMRKGDIEKSFEEIQNDERVILYKCGDKNCIQVIGEGHYQLIKNLKKLHSISEAIDGIDENLLADPNEWSIFFGLLGYIAKIK